MSNIRVRGKWAAEGGLAAYYKNYDGGFAASTLQATQLYDSPAALAVYKKWTSFFHKYR
jgi:hypothetical protein